MTKQHIVIATRESPLALQQAHWVKNELIKCYPDLKIEFLGITTQGDKRLDVTLSKIGGKGLFVKELEEALLDGRADIAVHSMKDVPVDLPPGLVLPVILQREDPRDVFVSKQYTSLMALPREAKVGTSSLRRQLQIKKLRSDIILQPLRGNIHTRLQRLAMGDYDAIILAAAGLSRMGLQGEIKEYFKTEQVLPSAGQGALGIECHSDNQAVLAMLSLLQHWSTQQCVMAERGFTRSLGGGCSAPVAAFAEIKNNSLFLQGRVMGDGVTEDLYGHITGNLDQANYLGEVLAKQLIDQGALTILREFS